MSKKVVLCMAPLRWNLCKLKKNFCCAVCEMREGCIRDFNAGEKGNKIRPCSPDMFEGCENRDFLEI